MKEQQAQAKRSHQRKEEEATRNRFMGGFARKIPMRQEEGKGRNLRFQTLLLSDSFEVLN